MCIIAGLQWSALRPMVVFLVNVGQSSDGRVSSVEPAVLIHIAVLQMARTVNWVPWVLTTVLTQQYPYGAFPAWEMAIIWSNTSVSHVQLEGHGSNVQKCSFLRNKVFYTLRAQQLRTQGGVLCHTDCTSVTLVDLFVSKSLSYKNCLYWTFSILYTTHGPYTWIIHWKYLLDTTLSVVHYSDLNYRQECAHTHTCHCLDREGALRRWVVGGRPTWPITALSYASQNISQGVG